LFQGTNPKGPLGVWRGGKGIALGGVEESEINI